MDCHLVRMDVHNAFLLVLASSLLGMEEWLHHRVDVPPGCSCNYQSRRAQ